MKLISLGSVRTLAVVACLFGAHVPANSQGRPNPQPQKVWGAGDVTVYRNSPKYFSDAGNHYLVYQPDGNLVVYTKSGQFVWGLNEVTNSFASAQRITFANGNIMAYDASGKLVWQALTAPNTIDRQARPYLTQDGVLQMFYCRTGDAGTAGGIFWASDKKTRKGCLNSAESAPAPTAKSTIPPPAAVTGKAPDSALPSASSLPLKAGTALEREKAYQSPSGNHNLTFAKDGNLVVKGARAGGFVWGSNDLARNYQNSDRVELRPDGSFVIVDAKGGTVWAAPQKRKDPRAVLTVSFSGALQVMVPGGEILWSSDGILTPPLDVSKKSKTTSCVPKDEGAPEWDKCLKLESPKMIILGSKLASTKAMNAVANVYTELTKRFKQPDYPKSKLDGFKVFLTNGESASALALLPPAGTMWKGTKLQSGDFLRGGASNDFLWLSEQMICQEGVKTRIANYRALGMDKPDYTLRTYDQVIHELGHSIHYRYGIADSSEQWPQAIQSWFGAPVSQMDRSKEALVKRLFTSQATFSCETY